LESSQGMTRYSVRTILETIFRRWIWLAVFAFIFAIVISTAYWHQYFSAYKASATFIPAAQSASSEETATGGSYSVIVSQSFIKHAEVLDAVAKSVSFAVSTNDLDQAISADVSESGMSVTVNVEWSNPTQAYEILEALKANLSYAVTHSAKAGTIKWLESSSAAGGLLSVSRARTSIVFILAGIAGIITGACVSFLIGCFDKRIYDPTRANYTGGDVRVIGMVGRRDEKQENDQQQVAAIAMYLKKLAETQDHKLMMCLSPAGQCGTSTVVQDVAQVLAGMQMKVLIVMIQSEANKRFVQTESTVVPLSPGVDRCVLSWDDKESNPDFDGPISSTLAMGMKKYDLVLADCPSLLKNIQMSGLAVGMDTTLLVCGYGVTKQEDLSAAVSLLSRTVIRPIYCVWNFVDRQYDHTYLPVEAEPEPRKETDESKNIGADVRI